MPEKRLLDANELAAALGVSRATVYNLRREGLPCVKIAPRIVRYDVQDVLQWLKARGQGDMTR